MPVLDNKEIQRDIRLAHTNPEYVFNRTIMVVSVLHSAIRYITGRLGNMACLAFSRIGGIHKRFHGLDIGKYGEYLEAWSDQSSNI